MGLGYFQLLPPQDIRSFFYEPWEGLPGFSQLRLLKILRVPAHVTALQHALWQIADEGSLHTFVPGDPAAACTADSFALEICWSSADPRCPAL